MKKLSDLEAILGITFHTNQLLKQALTHRSYLNEAKGDHASNERLEFLGDAILSFIISQRLYHDYPLLPEGELTNIRSAIVRTESLSDVAQQLNLGTFLYLPKGEEESGGRENASLLADCFEAVIGALFLDSGLEKTMVFVEQTLGKKIPDIVDRRAYKDFKSRFQEVVQEKLRESPMYKVLEEEGPDHSKVFTIGVYVDDELFGSGMGKSKQEAEQNAANAALEKWRKER